jgi:hypothetical protein
VLGGLALAATLAAARPVSAATLGTACQIDPPQAASGDEVPATTTIGPFSDPPDCEAARARLFGDLGRCHCTTGFTPARVPRDAPNSAGTRPGPDRALP